jgi:hypothetical protein
MHKLSDFDDESINQQRICLTWKVPVNHTGIGDYAGSRAWFLNGKLHRENGPAVEWSNGAFNWHLNGKYYTFENWFEQISPQNQLEILFKIDEFSSKIK